MKVKIIPDKGQSNEEAEEMLFKALDSHRKGAQHSEEFQDPVMNQLYHQMLEDYGEIYDSMLGEIMKELDKEYK